MTQRRRAKGRFRVLLATKGSIPTGVWQGQRSLFQDFVLENIETAERVGWQASGHRWNFRIGDILEFDAPARPSSNPFPNHDRQTSVGGLETSTIAFWVWRPRVCRRVERANEDRA